ncbi:hypothetical protein D3C71_1907140 [compost metagenome]
MPRVLAACSRVSLLASTAAIWAFSSSSRLSSAPILGALLAAAAPRPRWSGCTQSSVQMMLARSIMLRSSRMLPGQW